MKNCCENVNTPYCPQCGSKIKEEIEYDKNIQKLAIFLHKRFCIFNHSLDCKWRCETKKNIYRECGHKERYEPDWEMDIHAEYYEKAEKVLEFMTKQNFILKSE